MYKIIQNMKKITKAKSTKSFSYKRREMVKNLHKLRKTNKEIANILNIQERKVRDDLSFMKISVIIMKI